MRTRAGLSQLTELQQGKGKVSPQDLRDMLYNQRNYAAELLLDDLLVLCATLVSVMFAAAARPSSAHAHNQAND